MQTISIPPTLSRKLIEQADIIAATTKLDDPNFGDRIDDASASVPELMDLLQAQKSHLLMLDGLPYPAVNGGTPKSWNDCKGTVKTWRTLLVIIARTMGKPFGWIGQQDGRLVTDLVPNPLHAKTQTGASSSVDLTLHTEDAFTPRRATHFMLFGLRNHEAVGTTIAPISEAIKLLSLEDINLLQQPETTIVPDDSYSRSSIETSLPLQTLWWSDDGWKLRYDPAYTKINDARPEWVTAYNNLTKALKTVTSTVPIKPGQIAIINNDECVHGRVAFTPRYDGTDRWMLRINLMQESSYRLPSEQIEPGYDQLRRFYDGSIG